MRCACVSDNVSLHPNSGPIESTTQKPRKHVAIVAASGDEPAAPGSDTETELRAGARREILDAVLTRSDRETFTTAEIVEEMTRRGTRYAESTVRTMIGSPMCQNAPDNAATTYDDFERADRGTYRLVPRDLA